MWPKNKKENFEFIKKIGINTTESYIVNNDTELYQHSQYLINKYRVVGIRACDPRGGGGSVFPYLDLDGVLYHIGRNEIKYPVWIGQSMRDYEKDIVIQGEIQLHKDGTMWGRVCEVPGIIMRDAMKHEKCINFHDIWSYYKVWYLVDYVLQFNLIGPVIEFTQYSCNVGIKNNHFIIWEIRDY